MSSALDFAHQIASALSKTPEAQKIEVVSKLFDGYLSSTAEDWKKYVYFSGVHYTRNLVYQDQDFEVMVLCWKAGQFSRIHNHAGSHCWMGVLGGHLQETRFNPVHESKLTTEFMNPAPDSGDYDPLIQLGEPKQLKKGEHSYINDRIALHAVGAPAALGDGISLHIYHPPIRRVKIYEATNDTADHQMSAATNVHVTSRTPGFYSRYGNRDPARND